MMPDKISVIIHYMVTFYQENTLNKVRPLSSEGIEMIWTLAIKTTRLQRPGLNVRGFREVLDL